LDEVLRRAKAAGVGAVLAIGIGEGPAEMACALEICRKYGSHGTVAGGERVPKLFASSGIYPHNTHEADEAALARLDLLLAEPEVIACGEIGLDYYHEGTPHEVQKRVFVRQMEIAASRNRPIIIHCRGKEGDDGCWEDTLALLAEHWGPTGIGGILHCFSGDWSHAERAMELGFLISFAGNLTYPKAQPLRDVAARVPLDRLLVETDAPFLAPAPNRGKRNEPAWVADTAAVLAAVKGVPAEEIGSATTKNFARLFGLTLGV
jgi:TatD DNase family protein